LVSGTMRDSIGGVEGRTEDSAVEASESVSVEQDEWGDSTYTRTRQTVYTRIRGVTDNKGEHVPHHGSDVASDDSAEEAANDAGAATDDGGGTPWWAASWTERADMMRA
jgi:hypothetical protein